MLIRQRKIIPDHDNLICKYFFENAYSTLLIFVTCGFLLSLSYNFSYFHHIEKFSYLTLLTFNDYVESSLKFIVLILIALFYAQSIHIDTNGVPGKFRSARRAQKEILSKTRYIHKPIIRNSVVIGLSLIAGIIISVQILGIILPYLVASFFAISAFLDMWSAYKPNEASFFRTAFCIPLMTLGLDWLISNRPAEYKLRKLIMKVALVGISMSVALGAYDASKDITTHISGRESFLRSVNKGVLLIDDKNHIIFKPWAKVDVINN